MNPTLRIALPLAACLALCFLAPGCAGGPKLVKVKGQITRNGRPLVAGNGATDVIFVPLDKGEAYDTYPANVNGADGSYEVLGKDRKGIPVGTYRITISQMLPPTVSSDVRSEAERLNRTYASMQNSPIVREITSDEPINIDVAKPK